MWGDCQTKLTTSLGHKALAGSGLPLGVGLSAICKMRLESGGLSVQSA